MNPASVGPGNLAVPMTPLAGEHFQPASNIPMIATNAPQTPGSQLVDVPSPALQNIVSTVNLGSCSIIYAYLPNLHDSYSANVVPCFKCALISIRNSLRIFSRDV